jgi:hypothetical protein
LERFDTFYVRGANRCQLFSKTNSRLRRSGPPPETFRHGQRPAIDSLGCPTWYSGAASTFTTVKVTSGSAQGSVGLTDRAVGHGEAPTRRHPRVLRSAMKRTRIRAKASPGRARRSTKRAASNRCQRELALYDGTHLLGTIKVAANGKSVAYDTRGKRLGSFSNFEAASAAFPKPKAVNG